MAGEAAPDPALLGILALLAADRAERDPEPKFVTEVVLADAGLDNRLIGQILGKNADAVRMKVAHQGRRQEGDKVSGKTLAQIDSEAALRALVILCAADRAEREPEPRVSTERLLHEAGFTTAQIGAIIGDKADTVRKRLERAKKNTGKSKERLK